MRLVIANSALRASVLMSNGIILKYVRTFCSLQVFFPCPLGYYMLNHSITCTFFMVYQTKQTFDFCLHARLIGRTRLSDWTTKTIKSLDYCSLQLNGQRHKF